MVEFDKNENTLVAANERDPQINLFSVEMCCQVYMIYIYNNDVIGEIRYFWLPHLNATQFIGKNPAFNIV